MHSINSSGFASYERVINCTDNFTAVYHAANYAD